MFISIRIKNLKSKYYNNNVFIKKARSRVNVYFILFNYLNKFILIPLILSFNELVRNLAI